MVIVAAIALSTMVSNHIVMPIWLALRREGATVSGDVRDVVLAGAADFHRGVLAAGLSLFPLSRAPARRWRRSG
jgi:hypothetical protein